MGYSTNGTLKVVVQANQLSRNIMKNTTLNYMGLVQVWVFVASNKLIP
jgi:hypothetical protein